MANQPHSDIGEMCSRLREVLLETRGERCRELFHALDKRHIINFEVGGNLKSSLNNGSSYERYCNPPSLDPRWRSA
jgi:hypothetical protein